MTPKPEDAPPEWYATAWRRFWAGLIDGFVLEPLIWLNGWIWSAFHTPLLLVPWCVFFATSSIAYSVLLHWRWGQTLGKRVTEITGALVPWRSPFVASSCNARHLPSHS